VAPEVIARIEALERQSRLQSIFESQTNVASNLAQSNLLSITVIRSDQLWFPYRVKEDGKEEDHRMTPYAIQASHWKDLSAAALADLRAAIDELPAESASPPLDRNVVVSFKSGTNWLSRIYDFEQQPKALRRIYEIIGERWELRQVK
jgi:hypothetical protein